MLKCPQLEEIEQLLLEVPRMVDRYERRESDFVQALVEWLTGLEKILKDNRVGTASDVAVNRAMVISARRGVVPQGIAVQGRVTRRKLADAAAIHALHSASSLAASSIEADRERHRQAQEMAARIVALAVSKELSGFRSHDDLRSDENCWQSLWNDPDTRVGAVQLLGLVGYSDALILLSRSRMNGWRSDITEAGNLNELNQ